MAKLGDIFNLQMGKTPSRANKDYWNNGNNPWVSIADLSGYDKYVGKTKEQITNFAVQESGIKLVPPKTLLMSFKLSVGKTAITNTSVYTNEAIMAFIPTGKYDIYIDYFFYLFSYKDWFIGSNRAVMGATLNKTTLNEIEIIVPPISEQRRIASILDKVTDLITKRRTQLEKLDLLVKSRFVEMFGDPVENNFNWKTNCLKRVTKKIGSGATPKGGKGSYQNEGISLIRSMNVHDSKFEYKDLAHINSMQAEQLNNVIVEKYDVLINITGASVARSCVVPENVLPARVNQHVSIIRCCDEQLNHIFVNCLFLNESYKRKLLSIGEAGGATRQAITKQQLEDLIVILPPIELQKQFASFVQQTETTKSNIQKSLETLETLKKALMQEYFA